MNISLSLPEMAQKEPLRILFLTFQGDLAGSTQSIAFLSKGLADKGHKIYVGIRKESLLWSLLEGSKVERIAMTFGGKFDFNNWRDIRNTVKRYQIQIINPQSSIDRYTSIFSKWRFNLQTKIIHTRRQMPLSAGGPLQLYLYNKRTDGIVAVSNEVAKGLKKLGIKEPNIKVLYNGTPKEKYDQIDPQKSENLKKEIGIGEGDYVIGCVSRMKNQIQIIKALALIKQPVRMIFCGIEATQEMEEIIGNYETPHQVHFIGRVPSDEVLNYYQLFNLKVLASIMEGLSQSLLEAMALGVPVIATAYAGNLDLIQDGQNGLLFEDGNIESLAQKIEALRHSTEMRQKLSAAGKEIALEKFSIENTVSNYENYFYEQVEN